MLNAGRRSLWFSGLLAIATLLVFSSVFSNDFFDLDTPSYIHENPHVRAGLSWEGAAWAFTSVHVSNWHPVTWLSHMLDVQLFGLNATAHHSVNLLLHIANSVLLFLFLKRTTLVFWPAALVTAFFAIHPMHVESVAWVAERKDMLSLFFMLLSLHAYASYAVDQRIRAYLFAFLFALLGIMSKPMLVTLPFVLLLLDYWPLDRIQRVSAFRLILEKMPFFVLTGASIALTWWAQRLGGAMDPGAELGVADRLANAVYAYSYYLKQAIIPSGLAVYYPHPGTRPLAVVAVQAVVLAAIGLIAIMSIRKRAWIFVGLAFFFGTLVPVIGLVQVGAQAYADRYTYIPYIGLFIAAIYGFAEPIARYRVKPALLFGGLGLLLIGYSTITFQYLQHWRDSATLWSRTLLVTDPYYPRLIGVLPYAPRPPSREIGLFKAYFNLGLILTDRGRYEQALLLLDEATRLRPDVAEAHYHVGHIQLHLGRHEEALRAFAQVEQLDPHNEADMREIAAIRSRLVDAL